MTTAYWVIGIGVALLLLWWMFGSCSGCGKLPSGNPGVASLNPTVATTSYGR